MLLFAPGTKGGYFASIFDSLVTRLWVEEQDLILRGIYRFRFGFAVPAAIEGMKFYFCLPGTKGALLEKACSFAILLFCASEGCRFNWRF